MIPTGDELARAAWTQAWQVTVLIVVVALSTRLLARNRPHLAHALWLVVLLKCVTPPVWSSASGAFCWVQSASSDKSMELVRTASLPVEEGTAVEPGSLVPTMQVESSLLTKYGQSDGEVAVRRPCGVDRRAEVERLEKAVDAGHALRHESRAAAFG